MDPLPSISVDRNGGSDPSAVEDARTTTGNPNLLVINAPSGLCLRRRSPPDPAPSNRSRSRARIWISGRRQEVARRRYRSEEIIAKLREAEILLAQGMKAPEVVRKLGTHEVTYYRLRMLWT